MNKISYVIGDATSPQGTGDKIIAHICNNKNRWGSGFVLTLSAKWGYPEYHYRARQTYPLGDVDVLSVDQDDDGNVLYVANMIAQHDTKPDLKGNPPIRYDALRTALSKVNKIAMEKNATIHAPRFGAGLAGGDWSEIEKIIIEIVTVDVTVYDLK